MKSIIKRVLKPVVTRAMPRRYIVWHGTRRSSRIALTFDDGPDPECTAILLKTLSRFGVRATFFPVGALMDRHPEMAQRLHMEGHVIGNHTYSHANLNILSPGEIREEIEKAQAVIQQVTGKPATLFRPPYGFLDARAMMQVMSYRLTTVFWSVDPEVGAQSREAVIMEAQELRGGDILLLHDKKLPTLAALPEIIQRAHDQGFDFVTVPELLGR